MARHQSYSFKAHKVLMIIIITTNRTSPTPRPTLSLRSDALLLNLEASDRKRSLDAFSLSDLIMILGQILWLKCWRWTCLEGLKDCCPGQAQPQCYLSSPQSPWKTTDHPGDPKIPFGRIFMFTSSTWLRSPANRSPSRGPVIGFSWIFSSCLVDIVYLIQRICLARKNHLHLSRYSPLQVTCPPPHPLQALGRRSPPSQVAVLHLCIIFNLLIWSAWFVCPFNFLCRSHYCRLYYLDILATEPCSRDSGTSVSGRKVGNIMKQPYFESVPVKSSNQLRFESAPVYRSWIKCYDAQLAVVAFHWWCNVLPAPDVATQMSPSAGYSQPTRHTFLNIVQYIQFGQISILLTPSLTVFSMNIQLLIKFGACSAEFGAPGWSWQCAPPVREAEYVGCVVPPAPIRCCTSSAPSCVYFTQPDLRSAYLSPTLACILASASLWAVRPRSVGFWSLVAWQGCLGQVRISCRDKEEGWRPQNFFLYWSV